MGGGAWYFLLRYDDNVINKYGSNSNELHLYDMSGNVWEWCDDFYHNTYPTFGEKTGPAGPLKGSYKVIRGEDRVAPGSDCRITNLWRSEPDIPRDYIGFRPVME